MRKKTGYLAVLLTLLLCISLGWHTPAAEAANANEGGKKDPLTRKAVIVLLEGLRVTDITQERTPNLWKLQQIGSVGVMNLNTLGPKSEVNAALTIGAGSKAGANVLAAEAYEVDEPIHREGHLLTGRELYNRHMGTEPTANAVLPQWPQLLEGVDKGKLNPSVIGQLGDAVHEAEGKTAVLGNSDWGAEVNRPGALIAADHLGQIDYASLRAGTVSDPSRPFGMRTDVESFYASYTKLRDRANLLVLELGDLGRWLKASDLMESGQAERAYELALREGDELVGKLLPEVSSNTLLAVLSPVKHPAADAPALSPVLVAGGDVMAGGMLTSGTTKRQGLIANYDLAPTLVQFLQGDSYRPEPHSWLGQPAVSETVMRPQANTLDVLQGVVDNMLVPSNARATLVKPWINAWIGLAALILLAELFRRQWMRFLRPLAEWMLVFPLAWLYVPLFHPLDTAQTVWYSLGLSTSIWMLLRSVRNGVTRLGLLASATVLTLVVDLMLGAPLLEQSVLSYDPIAGARYYGIGNEYMGVLLGALLLCINAVSRAQQKLSVVGRAWCMALFLLVIYLFAAPKIGTNAGGALAAAVGCTYALMQFSDWRMTRRNWVWLSVASAFVILGMVALNVSLPSAEQTHIGRAARALFDGQFGELYQIAARKMQLNLLLLRVSAWGKLFLILLAFLLLRVYLKRETAPVQAVLKRNGRMVVTAALAAFVFNDSGVVAAALTLLYATVPLVEGTVKQEREFANWDILANDTAPQD